MTRLVRVRSDCTLVLLDEQGNPHVEVRPHYHSGTGPALEFHRVGLGGPEYQFTLRLNSVSAMIRKLPIVCSAAKRLQNAAK